MRVYTATKFENYGAVRWFNDEVRKIGHTVTWDWTRTDEFDAGALVPGELPSEKRKAFAMLDYAGVMACELLILFDHPKLNGARWEAGMAVANGAEVWIVAYENFVIFDELPMVEIVESTAEVFRLLRDRAPVM